MKTLKLLVAAAAALFMSRGAFAAPPPVAVYDSAAKALTFYNDGADHSGVGKTVYSLSEDAKRDEATTRPAWYDIVGDVRAAVIDVSFRSYRPPHCRGWFLGMNYLERITGLENLDVSAATNLRCMFQNCLNLKTLDLSSFDTKNVTDYHQMFHQCSKLETIYVSTKFVIKSGATGSPFLGCSKLKGRNGTACPGAGTGLSMAWIDGRDDTPGYFTQMPVAVYNGTKKWLTFYFDSVDHSSEGTVYSVFEAEGIDPETENPEWCDDGSSDDCSSDVTKVVFDASFRAYKPKSCACWFFGFEKPLVFEGLDCLDVSQVTDFSWMFAKSYEILALDLSTFDMSSAEKTKSMFDGCSNLQKIIVSPDFGLNDVMDSSKMFMGCTALKGGAETAYADANPSDKTYARIDGGLAKPGYFTAPPVAVYDDATKTLTFYNDGADHLGAGKTVYSVSKAVLDANTPPWWGKPYVHVAFDPSFKTYKPANCYSWFDYAGKLQDVKGLGYLDVSEAKNLSYMFRLCESLETLDLTGFDTKNVTTFYCMFYGCKNLRTIYASDKFVIKVGANGDDMFKNCDALVGGSGTAYAEKKYTEVDYARIDEGPDSAKPGYFKRPPVAVWAGSALTFYDDNKTHSGTDVLSVLAAEEIDSETELAPWWKYRNSAQKVVFDVSFRTYRPRQCANWFVGFGNANLKTIDGLDNLDVSEASDLSHMFSQCANLESLDLSGFDTANVTDMSSMFYGCKNLKTIYVSQRFDMSGVARSGSMFANCSALRGGQGTKVISGHTDGEYARIDGGEAEPGYFTAMPVAVVSKDGKTLTFFCDGADHGAEGAVHSVILAETQTTMPWDASKAGITKVVFAASFANYRPTSCASWFDGFAKLATVVGCENLVTSDVTTMANMFKGCSSLTTLDITDFDTAKVTSMYAMFAYCSALETIYAADGKFTTGSVTSGSGMFTGCTSLRGGSGTSVGSSLLAVSYEYARIDGGKSKPGYFTAKKAACAVYDDATKTLTFHYDAADHTSEGKVYALPETKTIPAWCSDKTIEAVEKAVFADSFAAYRPKYCNAWFDGAVKLAAIEGLDNLDVSETVNMDYMFSGCDSLVSLDLSGFDTANVTSMEGMFVNCDSLEELNVASFSVEKVEKMEGMFRNCPKLVKLDLGSWNTMSVQFMQGMFAFCESLTRIYAYGTFVTTAVTDGGTDMFNGCKALKGGEGTTYAWNHVGADYARVDGDGGPGYFTKHDPLKVTFDPTGGVLNPSDEYTLITVDEPVGKLPVPTLGGHVFDGWFTALSGGEKVTEATIVEMAVTFYAQWTAAPAGQCVVTFNPVDGTVSEPVRLVTQGEAVGALPVAKSDTFGFKGWFTASSGGTKVTADTVISSDVMFYAQWESAPPGLHLVTFDANGGTVGEHYRIVNNLEKVGVLPFAEREGYDFVGWFDAKEGGTQLEADTHITKDATYFAQWDAIVYQITYNLNGGVNHADNPTEYTVEDAITLKEPTREGYTFDGWTPDGGVIAKGSTGVKTFTANWTEIPVVMHMVTFDACGGTVEEAARDVEEGKKVGVLPSVEREGYNYMGWFTEPEGGDPVTDETTISADVTFYVHWEVVHYQISYNLNGGVNHADNPTEYTVEDAITLKEPTREGYTFDGWTPDGGVIAKGSTGVKTFTANWTEIPIVKHKVTFDANGGMVSEATRDVENGTKVGVLPYAEREGYNYMGWFTDPEGGDPVDTETIVNADVTFYVHWAVIDYQISYNLNGGVNHADNPTEYTIEDAITLKEPTREGYTFDGWTPDGGVIAKGSTGVKTFTANWTEIVPVAEIVLVTRPNPILGLVYSATELDGFDLVIPGVTVVDGHAAATDAGDYSATFRLPADTAAYDYRWADDDTKTDYTVAWSIAPRDVAGVGTGMEFDPIPDQTHTGAAIEPPVRMTYHGDELTPGTDYEVSYSDNVEVGMATATVTGKGNFTGTKELAFEIVEAVPAPDICRIKRPSAIIGLVYSAVDQDAFDLIDTRLTVVDGQVSGTEAGDYSATFRLPADTAEHDYRWDDDDAKGDFVTPWSIARRDVAGIGTGIEFAPIPDQTYTGAAIEPPVTMTYNDVARTLGTDYEVSYADNVEIGTATATVTGTGNFTGTKELAFKIVTSDPGEKTVIRIAKPVAVEGLVFTGEEQMGVDYDERLTVDGPVSGTFASDDYFATFALPGETETEIYTWEDDTTEMVGVPWKIAPRWVSDADNVTFAPIPDQTYTGAEIKPPVTMMLNGVVCTPDVDYTVSYSENVEVGMGHVLVVGVGDFTGSKALEFAIKVLAPGEAVVTFDANGGIVAETTRTVSSGNPVGNLPPAYSYEKVFAGWFTAPVGGEPVTADTVVAGDVTFYAQWQDPPAGSHVVVFDGNGGITTTYVRFVEDGQPVGELPMATRDGYAFAGWFTAMADGEEVTPQTPVTADMILHAQWTAVEPEFVPVRALVGEDIFLTLADLGVDIPDAGKVTVKVEGLPKGLKYKDRIISGVPTETLDFATQTMFARVTTQVGKTKVETLQPVRLRIDAECLYTNRMGVAIEPRGLGADVKSAKGLPGGLKYKDGVVTGTPKKAGVFIVTLTKQDKSKETFQWLIESGVDASVVGSVPWTVEDCAVTVMQGVLQSGWQVTIPSGAKVAVSGLPGGLKFDSKTGRIAGTPTKAGNFVVTFKTTLNGVTKVERVAMIVDANVWTGSWYGLQAAGYERSSLNVLATVAANGTVKLTCQENAVKTKATVKSLDASGTTATLQADGRTFVLDFANETMTVNGSKVADLCEATTATAAKDVTTFVLEEIVDGETNAYAYVTATYNAKKGSFALAGKLWDGTAVKGTTYALDKATPSGGLVLAPVLLTDKANNAVYLELSDDGSRCRVLENGEVVAIGADGTTPWGSGFAATALKGVPLIRLQPTAQEGVVLTGEGETAVSLTDKDKQVKLGANGLVKLTLSDADGWKWVCEVIPVGEDGATQFRGIATGTMKGAPTQTCTVFMR